jgi:cysteine desulfurase family protein (TIGR01976 family)
MKQTLEITSVEEIRSRFPALTRRVGDHTVAHFDGPGGTQVPERVVAAITDYLFRHNANTHWAFATSRETDTILEDAREALADLLGGRSSEIVFGQNMTSLTYHLSRTLGRRLASGDRIVVTELDHQANVAPWQALVTERAVDLRVVRMDPIAGTLDLDDLHAALTERPVRLLAICGASNALGTMPDVAGAAALAREAGAMVFVDAVHLAAHAPIDVAAMGVDFLCCSPYKFYGPHLGVLWGREDLLAELPVPKLEPAPDSAPHRFEQGTLNHEGIAGAGAAVEFLASLGHGSSRRERLTATMTELHRRGDQLFRRLWEGLGEIRGVRLVGPAPGAIRTPTLCFTVDGVSPHWVAESLDQEGVFVSHGHFYATTVIERLGYAPDGLVRAGCACYTTTEEVDRLIRGVEEVAVRA